MLDLLIFGLLIIPLELRSALEGVALWLGLRRGRGKRLYRVCRVLNTVVEVPVSAQVPVGISLNLLFGRWASVGHRDVLLARSVVASRGVLGHVARVGEVGIVLLRVDALTTLTLGLLGPLLRGVVADGGLLDGRRLLHHALGVVHVDNL